ncbi:MAG TPA: proline dehydrogenase family protein [Polyangiaceae bacterium]|nr:proline dehydrogenase family protein [Polyangiaceae bacterium]
MTFDSSDLEESTVAFSRALVEHARETDAPFRGVPDGQFFDKLVLDFCMRHPHLKAELFRFIDVLPVLSPPEVASHLREYLGGARDDLPAPLRWSLDLASNDGVVERIVARAARQNVLRMARRFIAGSNAEELVAAVRGMRERHLAATLDALGEAVLTEREADAYRDQYLALLRDTAKAAARFPEDPQIDRDHEGARLPRVNVSLKLSALTSIFDPIDPDGVARSVVPRLDAILREAARVGAFVHVDMEHYERKDLTLALFQEVLGSPAHAKNPNVGIVLQAYLRDAERDLVELAGFARRRGTPVWVRLVKGAYWDSETVLAKQRGWPIPVWENKWETDACYERCIGLLLDHADVLRPAFASHNVRSLGRALAEARARKLPERFVEFQALYGMADPLKAALAKFGQRVRVYMPFGELIPGMAYLVRRLLENTSNESFVRHELTEGDELDRLVNRPAPPPPPKNGKETAVKAPRETTPEPGFRNEPLRDFSRKETRDAFAAAVKRVSGDLGIHCPLVIDGREVDTRELIRSANPSDTRRVVASSGSALAGHADQAVAAAKAAFPSFRRMSAEERARMLERAAELFAARRDDLAAWTCLEAGKPFRDADADVAEAIDFCRFYAEAARERARPEPSDAPGEENRTALVPRGPTVVISPWNFPMAILTGMAAAALVTGNPVVLKPAEQTPACAYHVFRTFLEAGVPQGALHFLPGAGEVVGARLVEHPDVATIAFTGSRAVGHLIARRAAETSTGVVGLKRVIAEMGGKNAIVVDDDADLDEAIPGVLASAFGYAGQKCSACSRVVVVEKIMKVFTERLVEAARALVVGPADDPRASVGPLIDAESVARIRRYADLAAREGTIAFRGALGPGTEHGHFAAPVIVTGVSPDSALAQEEIFGPVLTVLAAKDFDHALAVANGTEYALTAGVYSRSPEHLARAKVELDAGNVYVNRKITGALVARQPFGGHRHSGTGGKAGGRDYLLHFGNLRTVTENTLRRGFAPEG